MTGTPRKFSALVAAPLMVVLWTAQPASAISVELAKNCRARALKAHPLQRGSKQPSTGKAREEYFQNCVAKDGKVD